MNKQVKYTYEGANQDITKSKHPFQFYFEGQHIKILATDTQSTGSVTNEKGNELVITLPTIRIIGKQDIPIQATDESINVISGTNITIPILNNDIFLYPVTITIISQPTKGTVVINNTNTITYTNTNNTIGIDNITYQIDDGTTTDTATVTITIRETKIPTKIDDELIILNNFDGQFYYYRFKPCDVSRPLINAKSVKRISDYDVYPILQQWGVGLEGKVAFRIEPISTHYNIGYKLGTTCPSSTIVKL